MIREANSCCMKNENDSVFEGCGCVVVSMCAPRGLCIQKEIKTKNICMNVTDSRKMRIGVP